MQRSKKEIVGTTDELFDQFNNHFTAIWMVVKSYLAENLAILQNLERDLITDSKMFSKSILTIFRQWILPTGKHSWATN